MNRVHSTPGLALGSRVRRSLLGLLAGLMMTSGAVAADMKVGVVLSNFSDKFVTYLRDGVQRYDREHDDVRVFMADAAGDAATLMNQIENFIDKKMNAVLIQPTDRRIVKAVGRKLQQAGIPLVVINHYPEEADRKYMKAYVGSRERQAGILQAEAVVRLLNGKPARVGILMGPLGLEAQMERTAGNREVFARHANIKVVAEQEARWDRAQAMNVVEDWLQRKDGFNVFVANNDEMALGAALAVHKAGRADDSVIVAGIDGTPDALAQLGRGLDVTVFQDARGQGYYGMQAAHRLAEGKTVVPVVRWIDFETVLPADRAHYQDRYRQQ
ncbi:MAG: substrate-binding domain-containing protein [Lautropia sp.]|nr:substrate-binding domain-containing protein [Lautropia sp.]